MIKIMIPLNSLISQYDWTSSYFDPRLISAGHSGQRTVLDAPALDDIVSMKDVYDDKLGVNYRNFYKDYPDIKSGNISYYYDAQIGSPFIEQLFDRSRAIEKIDYVDPMGSYKPHFERDNVSAVPKLPLTWLRDSQFQRQDIMAKQMWNRNQTNALLAWK